MQVRQPNVVTDLENAIRDERHSVSSKRVTESDEKANLPWSFETHIAFKPADLVDLPPPEEAAQGDQHSTKAADEPTLVTGEAERGNPQP